MAKLKMMIMAAVMSMMVLVGPHAEAAVSCQEVFEALEPCEEYIEGGGNVSKSCCSGVRSLNSSATTTPERQATCQCLKAAAEAYSGGAKYAAALPKACGVNIGYPISESVNCSEVH